MSRGTQYIQHLAKRELTEIPENIDIPAYCLGSVKRAQAFAAGYRRAEKIRRMAARENIIEKYGKMGYRAYQMGFDAAITGLDHLHRQ